jgi:hypothetical protein
MSGPAPTPSPESESDRRLTRFDDFGMAVPPNVDLQMRYEQYTFARNHAILFFKGYSFEWKCTG